MKNLFTLFLVALTSLGFAQQKFDGSRQPKQFKMLPGTQKPGFVHRAGSSARSLDSCNDQDVLDYSTYNELMANNLQISYNGSWNSQSPQPYGQEINSSFITVAASDAQIYSYVVQAFDSMAFANLSAQTSYSKQLSACTITLDTVYMFAGLAVPDTSSTGELTGDSLVLSIYPINGKIISSTAAQTLTYSGYNGLAPFVVGTTPGYLRLVTLPVGQSFAAGQGFAVGVQFYSSDTTSHFILSYSYADSCGTVSYMGQSFSSPAYPSPFNNIARYGATSGGSFWGVIDSTGPTTANVTPVSNAYGYFNLGFPDNCAYLYSQNWEILAGVSIQSDLSITINGANPLTLTCPSTTQHLTVTKSGDLAGATYSWSGDVTGSSSTANTTFFNPGTYTVIVTNSQGCTATDQLVASYVSGLNQVPSFSLPSNACANHAVVFTNTSPDVTGYSSSWTFGDSSGSSATDPSHTYTRGANFTVTLTIDSAGCAFSTSQTISVANICAGIENLAFENSIQIIPNPSNGNINLAINGADKNVTLTVYNMLGQVVNSFAIVESPSVFNQNLDLSNLANGTYLIKIQSGSKAATKKLVITK